MCTLNLETQNEIQLAAFPKLAPSNLFPRPCSKAPCPLAGNIPLGELQALASFASCCYGALVNPS